VRRSFDSLRSLRISARGSDAAKTPQVSFAGSGEFDSHTLPPLSPLIRVIRPMPPQEVNAWHLPPLSTQTYYYQSLPTENDGCSTAKENCPRDIC
jgi:hypothetical protein